MNGQEAFKDVLYILSAVSNNEIDTNCETIKTIEKSLKALEIIKEKEVNMQVFNQCEDAETYNKVYIKQKDRQLTGEEFETLKEVEEWVKN